MKKILLSASLFFSFVFYAASQKLGVFSDQSAYVRPSGNDQTHQGITPSGSIPLPTQQRLGGIFGDDDDEYEDDDDFVPRNSSTTKTPPSTSANTPISAPPSPQTTGNAGTYRNGTYTGPVVDAYYGNVQIRAIVFGGKITDVQFLDYPQDRNNSIRINNYAIPILRQEAITAQSAQVDAVSGATATSDAFIQSLASALIQAKN